MRIRTEASGQIRVKRVDGDEVEGITEGRQDHIEPMDHDEDLAFTLTVLRGA